MIDPRLDASVMLSMKKSERVFESSSPSNVSVCCMYLSVPVVSLHVSCKLCSSPKKRLV